MRKSAFLAATVGLLALAVTAGMLWRAVTAHAEEAKAPSRLCVVWSSGDPGVAKSVCFMYAHNAKRRAWFDEVHLIVWGPSDKLLVENKELQDEVKAMQKSGVVVEACLACAKKYGVVDALKDLGIDVKLMGEPLSQRLKSDWKVLTF